MELIEFHLSNNNQAVLNMLNTKYIIAGNNDQIFPNKNALGNAWFVKSIKSVKDADESILSLAINTTYPTNSYNGYSISNGIETDSVLELNGSQNVQLIAPDGKVSLLEKIPYQATSQQEIVFVNDTISGPQWTYNSPTIPSGMILLKMASSQTGFSPQDEAIVINSNIKNDKYSGEGTIILESYHPTHLTYKSDSKSEQFAVFSEIFYEDGWKAFIDGKEIDEIKRANYILRALEIPEGSHTIEFKFELSSYTNSNMTSLFLSILVFITYCFWCL